MRRIAHIALVFWIVVVFVVGGGTAAVLSQSPDEGQGMAAENRLYLPMVAQGLGQQVSSADEQLVVSEVAETDIQAADAYWNREMFLDAEQVEPMPLPLLDEPTTATLAEDTPLVPSGPAGSFPGGLPDEDALTVAQALYAEDWTDTGDVMLAEAEDEPPALTGYNYPPPYTRYCAGCMSYMWTTYPWRAMGRLFFTIPGVGNASCSASVAVGRAVWTAGHCVYTPGRGFHTNMVFVPAYRNGSAPFGTFSVFSRLTLSGWISGGSNRYAFDIAMVAVRDRSARRVSSWVGWLGFAYNRSPDQHFHVFGYPGNITSSRFLIACTASTSRRDTTVRPATVGIGCDMTQGSSGGPWLTRFHPGVSGGYNFVNGVVSYGYRSRPGEFYASYFTNGALNLYNWGRTR